MSVPKSPRDAKRALEQGLSQTEFNGTRGCDDHDQPAGPQTAATWRALVQSHASDQARLLLSLAFARMLYFSWLFSNPLMATCPPPSRVPSPGYAFPQPLTRVTIVI
jgi:hypothetical protein